MSCMYQKKVKGIEFSYAFQSRDQAIFSTVSANTTHPSFVSVISKGFVLFTLKVRNN